ncbi:MAG: hypothetical protein KDK65_01360 [Chlamydiia bacterium]|nr:hypothetical protein [Chlamydiia bacterium]
MRYFVEQWQRGIHFDQIYFLTGAKQLHPDETGVEAKTEAEMMKKVWQQTEMPDTLRAVPYHVVDVQKERPNTDDTVNGWVALNAKKGSYLAVSHAPFLVRQDLVLRK